MPLLHLLHDIHRDVTALEFPFEIPGASEMRALRARVLTSVQSHLLPRLADDDTPAVVVLGGSTGVGKSTLFNTLLQREVSVAGVLRPTTRRAVIAHHPSVHQVPLRDLADAVATPAIPPGLVLLDAPDLDSLEASNRLMAEKLLDAADLWLFVTSAARYGDRIPWENLVRARDRGLQVGVVLNRVPPPALATVRADLLRMLDHIGLGFAPVFQIPDISPHSGLLPEHLVSELRSWLEVASGRHQSRAIIKRTTTGAWVALGDALTALAGGVERQAASASQLRSDTRAVTRGPAEDLAHAISSGECAVGAPTTRWALVSTGGPLKAVSDGGALRAGFRGRARAARAAAAAAVAADAATAVTTLLADAVRDTSRTVRRVWEDANARALLPEGADPSAAADRATAAVAAWRERVAGILDAHGLAGGSAMSPAGLQDLVIAGAVGVRGAQDAVARLVSAPMVCDEARAALVEITQEAVRTTASPFVGALQSVPTVDDAVRLRTLVRDLRGHLDAI